MNKPLPNSFRAGPDDNGRFGIFGGRFVAETLMPLILDLEQAYAQAKNDPSFHHELEGLHKHYVGRPSPLYFAERITEYVQARSSADKGAKVYFKRDELNHTGAHKINNVLGQILLARRMGKKRIIAETGAGQHGVATATACARFGLQCVVYMGAVDVERQKPNVFRMKMLGAEIRPVQSGARTLKDAMNEALRDWVTNVSDTFYCIGTAAGPHPYPAMVRDFQSIIGNETRVQMQEMEGRLPDSLVACIGGGSNAIGLFHPFLDEPTVEIYGVEAAGHGVEVKNGTDPNCPQGKDCSGAIPAAANTTNTAGSSASGTVVSSGTATASGTASDLSNALLSGNVDAASLRKMLIDSGAMKKEDLDKISDADLLQGYKDQLQQKTP